MGIPTGQCPSVPYSVRHNHPTFAPYSPQVGRPCLQTSCALGTPFLPAGALWTKNMIVNLHLLSLPSVTTIKCSPWLPFVPLCPLSQQSLCTVLSTRIPYISPPDLIAYCLLTHESPRHPLLMHPLDEDCDDGPQQLLFPSLKTKPYPRSPWLHFPFLPPAFPSFL